MSAPFKMPIQAVEWTRHAATTIKDADGAVIAECNNPDQDSTGDAATAAELVKRVNAHDDLTSAARKAVLFIAGFEDDDTQPDVRIMLRELRIAIFKATGSAR